MGPYILNYFPPPATDSKQPSIKDALTKPKASKTAAKKLPSFESSDDEAPVTKAKPLAKPLAKRKQMNQDDSDSESDNLMDRIRRKTIASKVSSFLVIYSTLYPLNVVVLINIIYKY